MQDRNVRYSAEERAMRVLCSGTLAFWMAAPLVRSWIPVYPARRDGLRPVVLRCRVSPVGSKAGSKRPWGWPYSGPRVARIGGMQGNR